ncbi:hypothetical protein D3C87_1750500 [compost metagenome]
MAQAAAPLMEHRFANIIRRDRDGLTAIDIGHRTFVDGLGDRLFNLRFITAQEALAVHRALVFAVKTPVNKPGHKPPVLHLPTLCGARMAGKTASFRLTVHLFCQPDSRTAGQFSGLL